MRSAPRIDARLVLALARLDDGRPIADTHRRLGAIAEDLGLIRPSYQQTRVFVHRLRAARSEPSFTQVLLDVAFRVRPPEALLDLLP